MTQFTSSDKKAGSPIEAFAQGPMLSMLSQTCIKAQFGSLYYVPNNMKNKDLGYGIYIYIFFYLKGVGGQLST